MIRQGGKPLTKKPNKRRSDRFGSFYLRHILQVIACAAAVLAAYSCIRQRQIIEALSIQNVSGEVLSLVSHQCLITLLIAAALILCVILTEIFVFRPLSKCSQNIREGKLLPTSGIREMRTFASSYNVMFEQTKENYRKLSYAATHDAITGLLNRAFFESVMNSVDISSIALLIIDVDKLKQINDTYGHKTGDMALMRVGATLRYTFRAEDYVCRIGGDEFAVIMLNMDPSMEDVIKQKTDLIRESLNIPAGDVPPIFVSFGCAFGEKSGAEDLFSDADQALYLSKHTGGSVLNISR